MRIAILYICTGPYVIFWKRFYETFEKFFLTKCKKDYYVWSDKAQSIEFCENENVHVFQKEAKGWPYETLLRFHTFSTIKDDLRSYDYIFFVNANMICNMKIDEEDLFAENKSFILVQHPNTYNKKAYYCNFERNPKSKAYVRYNQGKNYVMGSFNGGKASDYLEMIEVIKSWIDEDLLLNIIPVAHDESYLNKYMIDRTDITVLTPEYCNPEDMNIPYEKKIIMIDKSKYFDDGKFKNRVKKNKVEMLLCKICKVLKNTVMFIVDSIIK